MNKSEICNISKFSNIIFSQMAVSYNICK